MVGTKIWVQLLNVLSFSMDCELKIFQSSLIDYISYIILQICPQLINSFLRFFFLKQNILLDVSPVLSRRGELMNLANNFL